jgi:hypothetical protein
MERRMERMKEKQVKSKVESYLQSHDFKGIIETSVEEVYNTSETTKVEA